MRARWAALMFGLALGLGALLPAGAPAFDGVPSGTSDRLRLLGSDGSVLADVSILESPAGILETSLAIPCAACLSGAAVGLREPGGPLSDVLFVAGSTLNFVSDTEGGPVLDPLPGMVFLPETGEPQDVSALLLSSAALAAGFTLFVESDAEAPEPASAALLALGTFGLWLARRGRPGRWTRSAHSAQGMIRW